MRVIFPLSPSLPVCLPPSSLSGSSLSPLSDAIIPLSSLSQDHPSLLSLMRSSLSPLSLSGSSLSPLSHAIIPLSSLSQDHPSLLSLARSSLYPSRMSFYPSLFPSLPNSPSLSISLSIPPSLLPSLPPSPTHPYFPSPFPFSTVSHKTDSSFTPHEFACLNHSVLSAAHNYTPPTDHTHFKLRQQPQASVQLRNDMLQKGGTGFI